jgi:copper chaperone
MTTRTYDVPGISCDHCKRAIETEVGKLADVDGVVADVAAKRVEVRGDATEAEVTAAIDEAGYDVAGVA